MRVRVSSQRSLVRVRVSGEGEGDGQGKAEASTLTCSVAYRRRCPLRDLHQSTLPPSLSVTSHTWQVQWVQ